MYYQNYYENLKTVLDQIFTQENEKIQQAGAMLAETLEKDGLLYVFGCGHSHMLAEELFYRAGGLVPVCPIFETATMLHEGAAKSSQVERMSGYAQHVISRYAIGPNDILLLSSTSGINPFCMEMAQIATQRGAKVIGISSDAYLSQAPRNLHNAHLQDVCHICIDNAVPHGDACLQPEGLPVKMTPISTVTGAYIINSILAEATQLALNAGVQVPVYLSGNIPGGAEFNESLIARYKPRIHCL